MIFIYEVPSEVEIIGQCAFKGCTSLMGITLPEGLEAIGEEAFYGCTSLISITLPKGLLKIGKMAFKDCMNLTIGAEVEEKPEGWEGKWNPDKRPVAWGYKK